MGTWTSSHPEVSKAGSKKVLGRSSGFFAQLNFQVPSSDIQ